MPCSVFTVPLPTLTGEQTMRSTPNSSNPTDAPTISAIESAAPTSWKWTFSMGTWWTAASEIGDGRADNAVDAQQFESDRRAHDIGNRIGRTHFVEMDFFNGHMVDRRFRFSQPLKNSHGVPCRPLRKAGLLDDFDDVREVAMRALFARLDVVARRADPASPDFLKRDRGPDLERPDGIPDRLSIRAGIRQRAHQHIAADSRECVQISQK